jgi:hypothetical protein
MILNHVTTITCCILGYFYIATTVQPWVTFPENNCNPHVSQNLEHNRDGVLPARAYSFFGIVF